MNQASEIARTGPLRNAEIHRRIVASTWELLEEQGYHDLTIEGVATRAGVGKATIYRWWRTKSSLACEAIASHLEHDPVPVTTNVRDDLQAAIASAIRNYSGTVAGVAMPALLADLIFGEEAYESFNEAFLRPRREASAAVMHRAIEDGLLPPDADVDLLLDAYAGAIFYRVLVSRQPLGPEMAVALTSLILSEGAPKRSPARDKTKAASA